MFDTVWKLIESGEETDCGGNGGSRDIVARLLRAKGMSEEETQEFLSPDMSKLADPFLLPDMSEAVERILGAVDNEEHITIFGDYDADGITATAILYNFLTVYLEAQVDYMLPSRFGEGYGMSRKAIDTIKERGTSLIITVDTGIVAFEEIKYASEAGIDVVVTDHHNCGETLPECCAVVDPMREDSLFPMKQLAGAGVAFKLVEALACSIGVEDISVYVPIAAIGTIGDSMPLTGENRIIVKNGLEMMGESLPGVVLAAEAARGKDKKLTVRSVAFGLVPKINAAGRMGGAETALELLLSEDKKSAEELLKKLSDLNTLRQQTESKIMAEASELGHLLTSEEDLFVMAAGEEWHHGVTGIVASKLVDKYKKPAIVLSGCEPDEQGKVYMRASARSVEGVNIHGALSRGAHLMTKFGGHEMAAGFTVAEENIKPLIGIVNEALKEQKAEGSLFVTKQIDCYVPMDMLTVENAEALSVMEPFGVGNPAPIFITDGFKFVRANAVGDTKKHLKFRFAGSEGDERTPPVIVEGISFNSAVYNKMVNCVGECACVYTLDVNEWQGVKSVSLGVIDIIDCEDFVAKNSEIVYNDDVYTQKCNCIKAMERAFTFNREELATLYKVLKRYGEGFGFDGLYEVKAIMKASGHDISWFKIKNGLDIFAELGFIKRESKGHYSFSPESGAAKRNLTDSRLFSELSQKRD